MDVVRSVTMNDDLSDHFEFVVDPDAEPADFDEVLAAFLLSYIRKEDGCAGQSKKLFAQLERSIEENDL